MNCFYCKGDMVPDFTTHVAELENCIVIIKHVPCLKCSQCGEVVYTGMKLSITLDTLTARILKLSSDSQS